jgi:hypothetical protein
VKMTFQYNRTIFTRFRLQGEWFQIVKGFKVSGGAGIYLLLGIAWRAGWWS